jgi:hypothetical protein
MPSPIPPPPPRPEDSFNPPPSHIPTTLPPDPFRPNKPPAPPILDYQNLPTFRPRRKSLGPLGGIFYCLLLIVSAVAILFLYRVGADGLYQSTGAANLGPLAGVATGPVEVYLVPDLSDDLRTRMNDQFAIYVSAIVPIPLPASSTSLATASPTQLGALLLAHLPNALYGVTDRAHSQLLIKILPVDSIYRQPGSPALLYFMEPLGFSRYRNAIAYLDPDSYPQKLAILRAEASIDLLLLNQQLAKAPPNSDAYFLALLDYNWLGKFLAFLNKLPNDSALGMLADSPQPSPSAGAAALAFEPANFDLELARAAVGLATLAQGNGTAGTFTTQGRGTPVLRIPVAGGNTIYFASPTPIGGVTATVIDSRFHFDLPYTLLHLFPSQPNLTQSPATP